MPYLHPGEMPRDEAGMRSYSNEAIVREFIEIGEVDDIRLFLNRNNKVVLGFINFTTKPRQTPVFRLGFKDNCILNIAGAEQVDFVYLEKSRRNTNFTSQVYKLLVSTGTTIVSDTTQFEPAKGLWELLAKQTDDFQVYVCDTDELENTKLGELYDGTNIPDDQIWTSGENFGGYFMVLILKSKVSPELLN